MGNRRKLTEVEEFYVQHNPENLTVEEMAIKMNCNKTILTGMINVAKEDKQPEQELAKTEAVPEVVQPKKYEGTVFTRTIGKGSAGGRKGVVVMTPAASEIADEARKIKSPNKYNGAIHAPCGEDYAG